MNSRPSASFVTRHFQTIVGHQDSRQRQPSDSNDESALTDDVSALAKKKDETTRAAAVQRSAEKAKTENHEERVNASHREVEAINESAKKLAINVDTFIKALRKSASEVDDNPQLLRRMEHLRRLSVNFIRCLEHHLPGYATALFVEQRDGKGAKNGT